MRRELQDRLLARVEELSLWAGSRSYEEGMEHVLRLLELLQKDISVIKTRDELRQVLEKLEDPTRFQERLILGVLKYMPQILRVWAKQLSEVAEDQLPAPPGGRPKVDIQLQEQIVNYIAKLRFVDALSMEQSKERAALRFDVSATTIQRVWDDRTNSDPADIRSSMKYLSEPKSD
jgi:hypothetical protein